MIQPVDQGSTASDWLPSGWTMEIRIQKSGAKVGRKIKCYYDPRSGSRFYSKKEVFRHLESVAANETSSKKESCSSNHGEDNEINLDNNPCPTKEGENKKNNSNTASTNQALVEHSPDGLPPGWIKETTFRKSKSRIKKDTLYFDPVGGHTFRSLKAATHFITAGGISECMSEPIKRNGNLISNSEPHPQTLTSRLSQPGDVVQCCLFSEEIPDMKVCGGISTSLATAQLPAQDKITGDEGPLAEKIELNGYNKEQLQAKKLKRCPQVGSKQSKSNKAIAVPVRASKRLAALRADDSTESGVGLIDAVSTSSSHIYPNSLRAINNKNEPLGILDVQHSPVLPSHALHEEAHTSVVSESKLLHSFNNGLSAEKNDLEEELKSELSSNGQSQLANPNKGHKSSSRVRFVKATTMPVRASKRLARLISDIPEKSKVLGHSAYGVSTPTNQLEAKPTEGLNFMVIDSKFMTKVSEQKPEERSDIVSEVLETVLYTQPENEDPSGEAKSTDETRLVDKDKLVEETTLGINGYEQPQSKKLKWGYPEETKKHDSINENEMPAQESKLVAKELEKSEVEFSGDYNSTHNNHMEEHSRDDHKLKSAADDERLEEQFKISMPMVVDKFKEQPKCIATNVRLEEKSNATLAIERFEESSTFPLPTEGFEEQKIELVTNSQHQEERERKETGGQEVRQEHAEVARADNHKPEYQFISLFGNSWPDPCIEFAFKTLTGDIPEDYFQQQQLQPDLASISNACPATCTNNKPGIFDESEPHSRLGLWDDQLWSFGHDDRHDVQSSKKNG